MKNRIRISRELAEYLIKNMADPFAVVPIVQQEVLLKNGDKIAKVSTGFYLLRY